MCSVQIRCGPMRSDVIISYTPSSDVGTRNVVYLFATRRLIGTKQCVDSSLTPTVDN